MPSHSYFSLTSLTQLLRWTRTHYALPHIISTIGIAMTCGPILSLSSSRQSRGRQRITQTSPPAAGKGPRDDPGEGRTRERGLLVAVERILCRYQRRHLVLFVGKRKLCDRYGIPMLINMNCMVNTIISFIVPIVSIIHNSHSVLSFPSQFILMQSSFPIRLSPEGTPEDAPPVRGSSDGCNGSHPRRYVLGRSIIV